MVMPKVLYRTLNSVLFVVLVGILSQSQVLAMGMDWGDTGGGDDTSCTPDATLVITLILICSNSSVARCIAPGRRTWPAR
jgi:hypothetical protein